jgi:hypothetical protein
MFGYRSIYVGFVAEIVVLEQDFPPVLRIYEVRSCNISCSGKALSMTYCVCAPVVLGIQHEMRMRQVVGYGRSGHTVFFHIISQTARYSNIYIYIYIYIY